MGMSTFSLYFFVNIVFVLIHPCVARQSTNHDVDPISVTNFDPQVERCSYKDEMFKKYIGESISRDENIQKINESDIEQNIQEFLRKHGDGDWNDKAIGFGQKGGEVASWMTAVVAASFTVAGVVASAASALSIVSPGVGLISWVFGIFGAVKSSKEHKELLRDIQQGFRLLNSKMNHQFTELKEYVDDSIIASDHERLVGELSQMQLHLSDCLLIKDHYKQGDCLEDRCSYVRAGFKKFALFADKLDVVPRTKKHRLNWRHEWDIQDKFELLTDKLLNSQEIKRVFANLPMFNTYVTSVLLQCETYRVLGKSHQNDQRENGLFDFFDDLDAKGNEWRMDEKVNTYLANSLWAIYQAHKSKAKLVASGYVKDYTKDKVWNGKEWWDRGSTPRKVQCRFQMNSHFKEYCDREYETERRHIHHDDAQQKCRSEMESEKGDYDYKLWMKEGELRKYVKIEEMEELFNTLRRYPRTSVFTGVNNDTEFSQNAEIDHE